MNTQTEIKNNLIKQLTELCKTRSVLVEDICEELVQDDKFTTWPASIDKHHNRTCGLLQHTLEVTNLARSMALCSDSYRNQADKPILNLDVIFISCLLHDYGKTYTYRKIYEDDMIGMVKWGKIREYTKSLHIYKSIEKVYQFLGGSAILDDVIHCVGAHHGRIDYGSLWEPKTPEAWIVHLADMASVFCIEDKIVRKLDV